MVKRTTSVNDLNQHSEMVKVNEYSKEYSLTFNFNERVRC